jgi:hypothetical protein
MPAKNSLPDAGIFRLSTQTFLRVSQESFDFADARCCVGGKIVLPDTQDYPALLTQRFRHQAIPTFVCGELIFPKKPVVDWHVGVLRASMPETPVHENDNPVSAEREVGFSE